jgi:predicted PurR-regulated permease PerM
LVYIFDEVLRVILSGKNISIGLSIAMFVFIFALFAWRWEYLSAVLRAIFFGFLFAYLLSPLSHRLERHMPRTVAITLLLIIVLILLLILITVFIPALFRQILDLGEHLPRLTSELRVFIGDMQRFFQRAGLPYSLQKVMDEIVVGLGRKASLTIGHSADKIVEVAGRLPELIISPVLGFYFLKDDKFFINFVVRLIPQVLRKTVLTTLYDIHIMLSRFIRGQLLIGLTIGLLSTLGFWAIGLPYALVLGMITGIFELIPYFGPWLGALPALLVALLNEPSRILWTIIVIVLIQQLEGSIIAPKIMGYHVGLHPVFIIIALWLGGIFFGVLGMLLAVPAVLTVRVIVKKIFLNFVSERL